MSYPIEYFYILDKALAWHMDKRKSICPEEFLNLRLLDHMEYIISRFNPESMKQPKSLERWIYMEAINVLGWLQRDYLGVKSRGLIEFTYLEFSHDMIDSDMPTMEELIDTKWAIEDNQELWNKTVKNNTTKGIDKKLKRRY